MKIAVVTTYPPGTGSLNEYAYHFIRYLRQKPEVHAIVLLTDILPNGESYPSSSDQGRMVDVEIVPCWRFNALSNPLRILRAVRACKPDVVLFNIQFATFGSKKLAASIGLLTPALLRLLGFATVVLLHNLMETIDLKSAGFGSSIERLIRFSGKIITRILLFSNIVAVTIPKYVELLEERYHAKNVVLMPHGAFDEKQLPETMSATDRQSIMTFGKFGTYKRVDVLLDAFTILLAEQRSGLELVIAGTDSPNAPGYLADIQKRYANVPGLRFTGYVKEEEVAELFSRATMVVFPYSSTTGSSGVLHQAGEHGRAVVLPNIGDFAEVISEEGYVAKFFEPENAISLARSIADLLDDPQTRNEMGIHNYQAAQGLSINDVVDWYLVHIQLLLEQKQQRKMRVAV